MNPERTQTSRAALAIKGARAARRRTQFVAVLARQLDVITPGTVRVHTAPTLHRGRKSRLVVLFSASGSVLPTTREQRSAAYGLLGRAFPDADWSRARTYDAGTGVLAVDEPITPAELGLDTAPEAHQ